MRLPPGPPLVWRRPDLLGDGQTAFWQGRFAQARDLFEAEGLVVSGEQRICVRGLAEIASGFLACDEGRVVVAERRLLRGLRKVGRAISDLGAVQVSVMRSAAELLLSALRRGQPASARRLVLHQAGI